MPEAVLNVYNSLSSEQQQEAYDFMMFLAQREPQVASEENQENTIDDRLKALYEFAGSMKDLWKGVDPVEYQRQMREDREIAW